LPIPDDIETASTENILLLDELTYDSSVLSSSVERDIPRLNSCQKNVFDAICNSAINKEGRTFFVYGYGGTGKIFLWTTILNFIRHQGKSAIAVASSGITTLLLPGGGRTPHSRFKIPLDIKQNLMCSIKKTHLLELICQTSLIVWDEAPVNHKYCFEVLDWSLRDIVSDSDPSAQNKLFGGITVALGGDFRQTLPVIQNSTKQQTLQTCIVKSYLWPRCILLQLTENMRLDSRGLLDSHREELCSFAEWILKVGGGVDPSIQIENNPSNKYIKIPQSLLLPHEQMDLDELLSFVYCLGCGPENPAPYFSERAILSPTNDVAASINSKMIQ
jgi:hypothetical protein